MSSHSEISDQIREKLSTRLSLDLRDATLLEALFTVRDASGLNVVVGNEVTGTVNASYSNSTVYDILDSLLITRGYGYRVVGESLSIMPLASLGDQLPLFETKVISLQDCNPDDLLPSIESMLSPEGRVHGVASSNSVVIVDYPERISRIRSHIDTLEKAASEYLLASQPLASPGSTLPSPSVIGQPITVEVFQPQYVAANILADAIVPLLSAQGRVSPVSLEDKLVVSDHEENLQRIAVALSQLDRPRPQVRIWAMIYDCGIEDLNRLGVNWNSAAQGNSIDSTSGNAAQSIVLDTVTAPVSASTNGLLTLSSLNRNFNLTSVIQALNSADDSRLLADPNVVVMNHEAAEIAIVTEVPYQQLTQGLEGGTIGTTEFREAGVKLNVTPHIAQDQTISLLVNPQFSLLTGFSEPDNAPIIDRRETKTTVRVANNQTIVLGGLRQRTRITSRSEIPLIGKVPYLGRLFRHHSNTARESELVVFITPEIVMPEYPGTQRETCIKSQLQIEIEETPTNPVPFGIEATRAETRAINEQIDHPRRYGQSFCRKPSRCTCPTCSLSRPGIKTPGMICADEQFPVAFSQHEGMPLDRPPVVVEEFTPAN
ncbi:MAG: secretin N-terminal domain-containing protein [Pirellulaceae bacterium]